MHLGTGMLVSVLVLFFSVTGALLAYERPILQTADKRFYPADPIPQNSVPLTLDTLVAGAMATIPQPVEMLTLHHDRQLPAEILAANRSVYFANRYSGKVEGPASPRVRSFFTEVTALHRWFGLSTAHHTAATAVKGVVALLFLFLLFSGSILWMPSSWKHSSLRRGMVPRFDDSGRARNYNWHKVTGFWTALPLGIIVFTGLIMAYPWANAQLFRLARSPLPPRGTENANARRHGVGMHALPTHLDEAFAEATRGVQDWQTATLRLPTMGNAMSFTLDRSEGGHPDKREQVSVDTKTLLVLHREPFTALSRGQQWRSWVRFAHTGEAGGWWGESLALMSACGAALLSITGVVLAFDRLRRWRRSASRSQVNKQSLELIT
jgi:uncharacterized iron-regulated membrane protein